MCYFNIMKTQPIAHYVYVYFLPKYPGMKAFITKFPVSDVRAFVRDYQKLSNSTNFPPLVMRKSVKVLEESVNITIGMDRKDCACARNNPPRTSVCIGKIRTNTCEKIAQQIFNEIKSVARRYNCKPVVPVYINATEQMQLPFSESEKPEPYITTISDAKSTLNVSKAEPVPEGPKHPFRPRPEPITPPKTQSVKLVNEDIWPTSATLGGIASIMKPEKRILDKISHDALITHTKGFRRRFR